MYRTTGFILVLTFLFAGLLQAQQPEAPFGDPRGHRPRWQQRGGERQGDGRPVRRSGPDLGRIRSECDRGGGFFAAPNPGERAFACYCPVAMRCIHTGRGTCRSGEVEGATIACPLSNDQLRGQWRTSCVQNFQTILAQYQAEEQAERNRLAQAASATNASARSRALNSTWRRNQPIVKGLGITAVVLGYGTYSTFQTLRAAEMARNILTGFKQSGHAMQFTNEVTSAYFYREVQARTAAQLTNLNTQTLNGTRWISRRLGLNISSEVVPASRFALRQLNTLSVKMGNVAEAMRTSFFANPSRLQKAEVEATATQLNDLANTLEQSAKESGASQEYQTAASQLAMSSRSLANNLVSGIGCHLSLDRHAAINDVLNPQIAGWATAAQGMWHSLANPGTKFSEAGANGSARLTRNRNIGAGATGFSILLTAIAGLGPMVTTAVVPTPELQGFQDLPGGIEQNMRSQSVEYLLSHYPYNRDGVQVDSPETACRMIVRSEVDDNGRRDHGTHVPLRFQEFMLRSARTRTGLRPAPLREIELRQEAPEVQNGAQE